MKRLGITSVIIAVLIAVFISLLEFLIPLYPAPNVNWARIKLSFQLASLFAVAFAVAGAGLVLWKGTPAKVRNTRTILLLGVIFGLWLLANPNRAAENSSNERLGQKISNYRFSSDWVSANQGTWSTVLNELEGKANIHGLEIGSFEGRSAIWFLENVLTHSSSTITCVDVFDGDFEETFDYNVSAFGQPGKIIKIKGASENVLRTLKSQYYDFAYIDGAHDAKDVLTDAILTWQVMKPGGVIIFDDYRYKGLGAWVRPEKTPRIAIDAFLRVYEPHLDVLHKDYQLVVRKRASVDPDAVGTFGGLVIRIQQLLG